jgi:hypothetical protein
MTEELRATQDRLLVLETKYESLLREVSEKLTSLIAGDTPKCTQAHERMNNLALNIKALWGCVGIVGIIIIRKALEG